MNEGTSFCHIGGQLDQVGDRLGEELTHLFGLGLVCDASISLAQAERHRDLMAELQRRGGLVAPSVYPEMFDPKCQDPNWWKYSESECERLLQIGLKKFATFDLGPLVAVTTYTPGNSFVAVCRRLGIRTLLGFCAPTVGEDGAWKIAHYGSPLSPYFVSDDDYRKPEPAGARSHQVLMVNLELRNPVVCLRHWNEGPFCPLNGQAVDRWLEPGDEPLPYFAVAEDWLRLAELTGTPRFFNINLQYFFADRCFEHDRRALEWIAEQRDRGRLEAGSVTVWARHMHAAGGFIRQTTYWRGEMMGFHVGHRPGSFPDVIVDEHTQRQTIWKWPQPVPVRCYDYKKRWQYPAFMPDGSAPASEDVGGITVAYSPVRRGSPDPAAVTTAGLPIATGRPAVAESARSGDRRTTEFVVPPSGGRDARPPEGGTPNGPTRTVEVVIANAGPARLVPLALWGLLEDCAGPFAVEAPSGWQASVLPHPAGTTGAVLLEGTAPTGQTRLELVVRTGAPRKSTHLRRWGRLLEAQTFAHRHQPYTVLVTQAPDRFAVTVRSKVAHVRVESLCGLDYAQRELPANGLPVQFDGTRLAGWHRFWGVTAAELEIEGVAEAEARLRRQTAELAHRLAPGLEIGEPGYQLFGDVTDKSRWDRALARVAGDEELRRINDWFHRQRPDAGEIVVEAHPGIYLPRGSLTHALAHEFDVIRCGAGYGFRELCMDYPQGWDWGVAGWIQWRHLNVQIDGLPADRSPDTLHLHAFDPEGREIVQRVHAFDPETVVLPGETRLDICLAREWALPRGLGGRWEPSALCSVPLPKECFAWKALGIWIAPLEKQRLYDWVAEKGAPGILCHAWLTRRNS